jgi:hypothetical protein
LDSANLEYFHFFGWNPAAFGRVGYSRKGFLSTESRLPANIAWMAVPDIKHRNSPV